MPEKPEPAPFVPDFVGGSLPVGCCYRYACKACLRRLNPVAVGRLRRRCPQFLTAGPPQRGKCLAQRTSECIETRFPSHPNGFRNTFRGRTYGALRARSVEMSIRTPSAGFYLPAIGSALCHGWGRRSPRDPLLPFRQPYNEVVQFFSRLPEEDGEDLEELEEGEGQP